jgi:hypothetical protein
LCCDPTTSNLYDTTEKDALPDTAVLASLGCGNPTALARLAVGETVLDLGSGGGIDVLLSAGASARRAKPTGSTGRFPPSSSATQVQGLARSLWSCAIADANTEFIRVRTRLAVLGIRVQIGSSTSMISARVTAETGRSPKRG